MRGGAGKRAPRQGRTRERNSNFTVNSLYPAAKNCLGFFSLGRA